MAISLPQLQALVALADVRSYSEAARRLRVTQPAITQHLANLARELDVHLVDTVSRRPVLTDAGTFLAERARAIVDALNTLDTDMDEFREARSGRLHVGATLTIGTYLIPSFLSRFTRERPGTATHVRIENTAAIARLLQAHEFGIALIEGVVHDEAIVTAPFLEDELLLVTPRESAGGTKRRVRAADLAQIPFISREAGSGTRDLGYDALVRTGVRPPIVLELPSVEAILRAVEAGVGAAILSRFAVEREARAGAVRMLRIADLPLKRSLFIAAVRGRTLSPLQRAFARIVLGSDEGTTAFEAALSERRER